MCRAAWLCAVVLLCVGTSPAQEACFSVPIELRGPLESARFEALGVASEVRLKLAAGETRQLLLPFGGGSVGGLDPAAAASALQVSTQPGGGTVTIRTQSASGPGPAPRSSSRRGRPPVAPERPSPDRARWLILVGGVVVLAGVRKRPRAATATGAVTAALLLALPAAPLEGRKLRGIDGDFARGHWIEVRSANEQLELPAAPGGWFEVRGAAAGEWLVEEGGRYVLRAAGGEVHSLRESAASPLDPATGRPIHALRDVWTRATDGRWTQREDWELGAAFPPQAAETNAAAGPTGWLAAGLPQGVSVLVAAPLGPGAPDWLRITALPGLESDERH